MKGGKKGICLKLGEATTVAPSLSGMLIYMLFATLQLTNTLSAQKNNNKRKMVFCKIPNATAKKQRSTQPVSIS